MAVSKRLRMEILRRDNFTCRYCGGSAPDVKLTIDHVVPTTLGGDDQPGNLVAACVDCNAGKSSVALGSEVVDDVAAEALRWSAAMKAAAALAREQNREFDEEAALFDDAWDQKVYGFNGIPRARPQSWRSDLQRFHEAGLPWAEMHRALDVVGGKRGMEWDGYWRYFCGICWNRIRKLQETARAILEAEDGS